MDHKKLVQEVIRKILGKQHTSNEKLIDAGLVGIIRARKLFSKKKRSFRFDTYAKHFIRGEVVAAFVGIDRKKAEKYAKLMGYIEAAKGNVKAILV